jgi:hypothetical protein
MVSYHTDRLFFTNPADSGTSGGGQWGSDGRILRQFVGQLHRIVHAALLLPRSAARR